MNESSKTNIFEDRKAFEYFKKIRNRLRKHYPEQIVLACIHRMNMKFDSSEKYIQEMRYFPHWFLFLLIKWSVKYGEYSSQKRRILLDKDFRYLINLVHDFFGVQRGPNDYGGVYLFFRTIAYQQFWLQENFAINKLGRQQKLFSELPTNHYLKTLFKQETSISIEDFIELTFTLLAKFISSDELFVTEKWFSTLEKSYPNGTISKFLSIYSKDWQGLSEYFDNLPKVSVAYEFHEQTPLRRYPLLKLNDKYYCYSRDLISISAQNIVYDILREKDVAKFMTKFGEIFERYVENSISKTNLKYITENELKQNLNIYKKVVDFIIEEKKANIFIDAKGIELSSIGMVSHISQIVSNKSRTSIIKGVEQFYSTVNECYNTKFIDVENKQNYLLVITYKDVFLGSGKDFLSEIAKDKFEQITQKYPNCDFIKSENIYFISIDDFDLLIELLLNKEKSITEVLEFAVESDKNNFTKKFIFRQHLTEIDKNLKHVRYLKEYFDEIANNCRDKIQLTSRSSRMPF